MSCHGDTGRPRSSRKYRGLSRSPRDDGRSAFKPCARWDRTTVGSTANHSPPPPPSPRDPTHNRLGEVTPARCNRTARDQPHPSARPHSDRCGDTPRPHRCGCDEKGDRERQAINRNADSHLAAHMPLRAPCSALKDARGRDSDLARALSDFDFGYRSAINESQ